VATAGYQNKGPTRLFHKRRVFRPKRSRYVVSPEHVNCLTRLLTWSAHYTQRCVEYVSFLPNGGQTWTRSLQIRIPRAAPATQFQIVSLGVYARRRFPDIDVRDASGARVDLLTRDQHGQAITQFVLAKHLRDFTREMQILQYKRKSSAHHIYQKLYDRIYTLVTSVGDVTDDDQDAYVLGRMYGALLNHFRVAPDDAFMRIRLFASHILHLQRTTQYLCWVQARPGEVISLMAKHTTADARRKPLYLGFANALRTLSYGLIEPRPRRRRVIAKWYCEFGLAPISYEFPAPGDNQIGSYYFTLEAPTNTDIVYVDFERSNSFQDKGDEVECSLDSVHIHNTEDIESEYSSRARLIRAYLRCSSHGHKQIAAGALLNGLFVALVAHNGFTAVTSDSAQIWLLATPTILTAYLVEQQRHYYAYATRRQRGILWVYLAISVTFLVVVSFHLGHKSVSSSHWHWFSTVIGILLATCSVAVFTLYALLGYSFRYVTTVFTRRKLDKLSTERNRDKIERRLLKSRERLEWLRQPPEVIDVQISRARAEALSTWRCYEKVVHRYCGVIVLTVAIAAILTPVSTIWWWSFPAASGHRTHYLPAPAHLPPGKPIRDTR
jgi:hypothetical protein